MDEGLKRRLIGATVLVSLAVIFVPMLLEREPDVDPGISHSNIPPRPVPDASPSLLPPRDESLGTAGAIDRGPVEQAPSVAPVVDPTPAPAVEIPVAQAPRPAPSRPEPEPPGPEPPRPEPAKPESPAAVTTGWVVQVGSFSNRENAEGVLEALGAGGFPAFVEAADVQGKQVFRVRVGPEADKRRAERMLADMAPVLKAKRLEATLKSYP